MINTINFGDTPHGYMDTLSGEGGAAERLVQLVGHHREARDLEQIQAAAGGPGPWCHGHGMPWPWHGHGDF